MVPYDKQEENQGSSRPSMGDHLLILHNDNINSFDTVIEALMSFCKHDSIQAEQCATITHYMCYFEVKRGSYNELTDLQKSLSEKSLKVTID